MESLRLHLKGINSEERSVPALQFVMLLDLADLSISDIVRYQDLCLSLLIVMKNFDLINWFLRQVIPRFPGMLAGGEASCFDPLIS